MSYAIRKDGQGWRAINVPEDVGPDETFSEEQPAPIGPSAAATIRAQRAPLLSEADIAIWKAEDNGQDATAWRRYRQALRDITAQAGFPLNVTWPKVPT